MFVCVCLRERESARAYVCVYVYLVYVYILNICIYIGYLTEYKDAPGPHMVLAPKSTMSNWQKEFRKWLPDHRCVYIGGTKEEREEQLSQVYK